MPFAVLLHRYFARLSRFPPRSGTTGIGTMTRDSALRASQPACVDADWNTGSSSPRPVGVKK